jgi:hypothetical protein
MCDIVDFIFDRSQSFTGIKRLEDLNETLPTYSSIVSENSIHENSSKTAPRPNIFRYAEINEH